MRERALSIPAGSKGLWYLCWRWTTEELCPCSRSFILCWTPICKHFPLVRYPGSLVVDGNTKVAESHHHFAFGLGRRSPFPLIRGLMAFVVCALSQWYASSLRATIPAQRPKKRGCRRVNFVDWTRSAIRRAPRDKTRGLRPWQRCKIISLSIHSPTCLSFSRVGEATEL